MATLKEEIQAEIASLRAKADALEKNLASGNWWEMEAKDAWDAILGLFRHKYPAPIQPSSIPPAANAAQPPASPAP